MQFIRNRHAPLRPHHRDEGDRLTESGWDFVNATLAYCGLPPARPGAMAIVCGRQVVLWRAHRSDDTIVVSFARPPRGRFRKGRRRR